MSTALDQTGIALLSRAARCYEEIHRFDDAARCRLRAGHEAEAARLMERVGRLAEAANHYLNAGRPLDAARCYGALDRVPETARCLEKAGDLLGAAWALLTDRRRPMRVHWARLLLERALVPTEAARLQHDLATALAEAETRGDRRPVIAAVLDVESRIGEVSPPSDRPLVRDWAVRAADRPDLAARVFAAAYLAEVPGTLAAWQRWALDALGGIEGLPDHEPWTGE